MIRRLGIFAGFLAATLLAAAVSAAVMQPQARAWPPGSPGAGCVYVPNVWPYWICHPYQWHNPTLPP